MKLNVGPAALVIQVKNKGMSLLQIKKIGLLGIYTLLVCMLFSCGSMRKSTTLSKEKAVAEVYDPLSPEERRKFDYFFMEAVRLKEKNDLDAAFEMYSHCLKIHPKSAVVLYELAKFYMYLGQLEKGCLCLWY